MRSDFKQLAQRTNSSLITKRKKRRKITPTGCFKWLFFSLGLFLISLFIVLVLGQWQQSNPDDWQEQERFAFFESIGLKAQELYQTTNLLPSVLLAQAALESDFGTSELAASYHNLFGVKAGPNEPSVRLLTKEYLNDEWVDVEADFRVYDSPAQSLEAHAYLLMNGTTWNAQQYQAVLMAQTPIEQADALGASGYATDPDYANKLLRLINQYHLTDYDPPFDSSDANELNE